MPHSDAMQLLTESKELVSSSVVTFDALVASMPEESFAQLVQFLSEGPLFKKSKLTTLLSSDHPSYEAWIAFLETHDISFFNGSNSKNFILSHYISSEYHVLKLENRLGAPRTLDVSLRQGPLKETLTPVFFSREFKQTMPDGTTQARAVVLTTLCEYGSLDNTLTPQVQPQQQIDDALNYYTQMATVCQLLSAANCFFPDMKNANWLLTEAGLLQIADTKSFVNVAEDGSFSQHLSINQGYPFLKTEIINPPEFFFDTPFSAEKAQVYMWGRNLYQYLTGCETRKLVELTLDYRHPIFSEPDGARLKRLIENTTCLDPTKRLSMSDVIAELKNIQELRSMRQACMKKIEALCDYALDDNDDEGMYMFARETFDRISHAQTDVELNNERIKLDEVSRRLDNNVMVKELLSSMKDLEQREFSPALNLELIQLKRDLLSLPLEKRSDDCPSVQALTARWHQLDTVVAGYSRCKQQLDRIAAHQLPNHDAQMMTYLQTYTQRLNQATSYQDMIQLEREFDITLTQLNLGSRVMNEMQRIIQAIKDKDNDNRLSSSKNEKYLRLEQALGAVPFEQRHEILIVNTPEAINVRQALHAFKPRNFRLSKLFQSKTQDVSLESLECLLTPDIFQENVRIKNERVKQKLVGIKPSGLGPVDSEKDDEDAANERKGIK